MKKWTTILFLLILNGNLFAQQINPFTTADQYVQQLGSLDAFSVASITDTLTKPFQSKVEKARAIYSWMIQHISIDPKASKSKDENKATPLKVMTTRQANAKGFANLFQEMCSQADIRCIVVEGFTRNNTEDIENIPDEANHAWNVVQLGKSETEWWYVDACKGSGSLDKRQTTFTRQPTYQYFFPSNSLFNLDHFATNKAWQLGESPASLKQFYSGPIIGYGAYIVGLKSPVPNHGKIKASPGKSIRFRFQHDAAISIQSMSLQIGEGNKMIPSPPFNFNDENGWIEFGYIFKKEGDYPISVFADKQLLLTYQLEVSE